MIAFSQTAVTMALLARLTAGATWVCGRVPDCVIDVGRACAKEHLPSRNERAAAAQVVAARNSHDVDEDGCYRETEITAYPDAVWLPAGEHMRGVLAYLECVETSEAAEDIEERAPLQAPAGGAVFQDGRGARPLTSESMLFVQSVSK